MVKQPIFHLLLTLSVVLILIGAAAIIFVQIDRGYVFAASEDRLKQQQNAILERFYEDASQYGSQQKTSLTIDQDGVAQLKYNAPLANPESVPSPKLSSPPPASIPQTSRSTTDSTQQFYTQPFGQSAFNEDPYLAYERYWLSQNPWSPDYFPDGFSN